MDQIKSILSLHPEQANRLYDGVTPLMDALLNDKIEIANILIDLTADLHFTEEEVFVLKDFFGLIYFFFG